MSVTPNCDNCCLSNDRAQSLLGVWLKINSEFRTRNFNIHYQLKKQPTQVEAEAVAFLSCKPSLPVPLKKDGTNAIYIGF